MTKSTAGNPVLVCFKKDTNNEIVITFLLDDSDYLVYTCEINEYYISCENKMKKSELTSSITGLAYNKTNVPTVVSAGVEMVTTMKKLAASGLQLSLTYLSAYLLKNGYPYTARALGYTSFNP